MYGGYAYSTSGNAEVTDNAVTISGSVSGSGSSSSVSTYVSGGYAFSTFGNVEVTDNAVTISGSVSGSGCELSRKLRISVTQVGNESMFLCADSDTILR
jgi:hypothetical protein